MMQTIPKIFPLRNDYVFKFVFGKEGNEPLLARLIDAMLHFEGDRRIKKLTLLSPLNLKEFDDDKFTIVDVKAVDHAGRRFVVEMQANRFRHFEQRMVYYLAHLYACQIREGDLYGELNPAYGIAILDYILFPQHRNLESTFEFCETVTNKPLPGLMELHFVELPKFQGTRGKTVPRHLQTRFERWLYVLKFGEMFAAGEPLPEELAREDGIEMAVKELNRVNADEQMRWRIWDREKSERDRLSLLDDARRDGIEQVVRNMLARGLDLNLIAEVTGLSLADIEELKKSST